jgi:hypothetical protein
MNEPLPGELDLAWRAVKFLERHVDLFPGLYPDRRLDLLEQRLQNHGLPMSQRTRRRIFSALEAAGIVRIEGSRRNLQTVTVLATRDGMSAVELAGARRILSTRLGHSGGVP